MAGIFNKKRVKPFIIFKVENVPQENCKENNIQLGPQLGPQPPKSPSEKGGDY